jgi:hypothetical protein
MKPVVGNPERHPALLSSEPRQGAGAAAVAKRHVIHIAGFDPTSPDELAGHMTSGLRRFAPVWGAEATAAKPDLSGDGRVMRWDVEARGPNWKTATRYTVLRWDELMTPYVERSWLGRVLGGYRTLLSFVRDGMVPRYFKANLRYGLFVIYPFLLIAAFVILAVVAGLLAWVASVPLPWLVGIVVFAVLFRALGAYFHLHFALSDWSFAADLVNRRVAGFDACLDRFTAVLAATAREPDIDEIVVSATSLGAVMLAEALARALAADPELCRRPPRFAMLTVGSSILKIGLHPAADWLRQTVARVGREESLFWVEYQAKVDFINFYRTDPVAALAGETTGRPIVRAVRVRDMMDAEDYRKKRKSLLQLHRQFVLPNGRRYFYDFYQICFGPLALADRLEMGPKAALAFSEDGSFRPEQVDAVIAEQALAAETS